MGWIQKAGIRTVRSDVYRHPQSFRIPAKVYRVALSVVAGHRTQVDRMHLGLCIVVAPESVAKL